MGVFITDKDGKLKKVAGNFIPKESPNLGCLRTEVVYDMDSDNPSLNWGYTKGIQGGNTAIGGKDFSKYQFLIITARQGNASMTSVMDLTILNIFSNTYNSGALGCEAQDTDYCKFTVNADKTEFTCNRIGYRTTSGSSVDMVHENAVCMKIVGVLKTPAMIYTGKELFAGNGISIENGVISDKSLFKWWFVNSSTSSRTVSSGGSLTLLEYTFEKKEENSRLLISWSCPVVDASNGYSSWINFSLDGSGGSSTLHNRTCVHNQHQIVDASKGTHTIKFMLGNGGSGSSSVPAYERAFGFVMEVL